MTHLTEQEARERYDFARVQLSQRMVGAGFTERPVEEFESAGERAYAVLREAILREDPHRQALETALLEVRRMAVACGGGSPHISGAFRELYLVAEAALKAVQSTAVSTEEARS